MGAARPAPVADMIRNFSIRVNNMDCVLIQFAA